VHDAVKLGYKFIDTNAIISELLEAPIAKAFTIINEDDFVKVERAVLDQVPLARPLRSQGSACRE
jgi:shikimate kinase